MSISVIIPAYNAARFLPETLRSVFSQTLPPNEVLVIDDGSTDATATLAEAFGPSVRVLRQANAGQSASRNLGAREATGEWLAFLDADDLWEPEKLACQMEELARHPAAALCYTARIQLLDDGASTRLGRVLPVPPAERIRQALYRNTTFLPSSVVVRRDVFLAAGGFDTRMTYVEDWDLWLRLLHAGVKFAACPEPLVQHRIHPASLSHNALASLAAEKDVFRRHVLPHLPRATRWLSHQRSQSGQEAVAAYLLRDGGDPRHLGMMGRSILRHPFHDPHRYKVLAHMLYTRLKRGR